MNAPQTQHLSPLLAPRRQENSPIAQALRKRPRVSVNDHIPSYIDNNLIPHEPRKSEPYEKGKVEPLEAHIGKPNETLKKELHETHKSEPSFSFFAGSSAIFDQNPILTAPSDHPTASSVAEKAENTDALPPLQEQDEPVVPDFQLTPAHSQPKQAPLLSDFAASNADIEVITLDDDDDDVHQSGNTEHQPSHLTETRPHPLFGAASEVIDLDDEEALANLQPLPTTYTKLQTSRGGGLFRVQGSGQLEIVDSDDEEELTRTHRLVVRDDGLHTISNITDVAQHPIIPAAQQTRVSPHSKQEGLPLKHEPMPDATEIAAPSLLDVSPPSSLALQPKSEPEQAPHTTPAGSSFQFSSPMMTRWPQSNMYTDMNAIPLAKQEASNELPSADMFLQSFTGGLTNEPFQHELLSEMIPVSGPNTSANSEALLNGSEPLNGTEWLNSRSLDALLQPHERIALARLQGSPVNAAFVDVNAFASNLSSTQVSNPKATLATDKQALGGSLPVPDDNGISAEGLRNLVKQNGLTADATKEADTPSELNVSLMAHQRRALHWMSKREMPIESDEDISAVDEQCLGGILADDQGLGKTLTMIALLLKNRPRKKASVCQRTKKKATSDESIDLEKESDHEDDDDVEVLSDDGAFVAPDQSEDAPWKTLIVCPPSVVNQWKEEICSRIRTGFAPRVCIYHGPKRERRVSVLENCDVVITTYATLVTEYPKILKDHPDFKARKKAKLPLPKRKEGPICRVSWQRVVLDEAQHVKNRGTDSWSAVMSLKSEKRWCLTGTPIQNSVDDIYSLFCFIRYHFVPNYETWNTRWKKRLEHSNAAVRERAFKRFQTIVGVVLLRRTKNDTIKGAPLIKLPKRWAEVETPEFCDKEEGLVYRAVQEKSVLTFNKFLVAGTLANNYSSVLLVLLRLRQACSHPFLIEYAGMHNRGRALHRNASEAENGQYSTSYSTEDLEEAMELVAGGYSLLSMIDDAARERVKVALMPSAKGKPPTTRISCQYCQRDTPWSQGSFLACGHLFCPDCCQLLRKERKCLQCLTAIEDPNVAEVFINADEARKEVHAGVILAEDGDSDVTLTASEFKSWFQLEVIKRRSASPSDTATVDTTDGEADRADDDDDDETLDQLEKSILEKRAKSCYRNVAKPGCRRMEAKKEKLLRALSQHSTKIRKILGKLNEIRERDPNEKTLVFSQWTSMLDIIEFHVLLDGHEVCRLDGSMTISARQQQIEVFKASPTKNVFLISLHAGGTGINLTAASNVIIADVWWNPAVEEQAIDRAHRIGQTKDVNVTRFKMKGTVEERIYAICAKKREAADGTLGVTGAQSLGRKKLSLQELMYIFGGAAQNVAQSAQKGSAAAHAAENILNYGHMAPM